MNKSKTLIGLIIWLICSLALAFSVIGLLLFIRTDYNTRHWQGEEGLSTWSRIGLKLTNKLIKD